MRILCYGDSNTRGFVPGTGERYPSNVRWTGRLQEKLGPGYEAVEEGLNGRTTTTEDPKRPGKNGEIYLLPCLEAHNPLDLVILMLGTNDLKIRINQTPEEVAQGIESLIRMTFKYGKNKKGNDPKIIIISPILVDESAESVMGDWLGAEEKSKQLAPLYKQLAQRNNCEFIDAAQIVSPSPKDGLHLESEDHQKLAEAVYSKIKSIVGY